MSVSTNLVIEAVNVKDKQGKPIKGLTAKDFTITEDGVPQQISFADYQELPTAPVTPPAKPTTPENITVYNRLSVTQIAAESPGTVRYKDRRLISMYFDLTAMPPDDKLRALEAAQKFIRTQMTSADLVSIMRYGGSSVDVLQDFTADHDRLLSILETLIVGENQQSQDDRQRRQRRRHRRRLRPGQQRVQPLQHRPPALRPADRRQDARPPQREKGPHLLRQRPPLHGIDNQAQLHATINDAIRSGVSFWPIDARGLVAQSPARRRQPGLRRQLRHVLRHRHPRRHHPHAAVAGHASTPSPATPAARPCSTTTTSPAASCRRSRTSPATTSSATTPPTPRSTATSATSRSPPPQSSPPTSTTARATTPARSSAHFTTADKERQLEDALMLGDPVTELTIAMELNYFQLNRAEYFVPIVVKIPGRELALAKKRGAEHTLIDFVLEVKDEGGYNTTVQNLRDNVNIKLTDATAAELAKRPVEYDTGFTLLPGKYSIKFLARDDETGRIGTFQTSFVIPNLNKEIKQIPISSVVLAGQRVDLKDAIYNASKEKERVKDEAANPLVLNGQKLIPSVTRVFSKTRDLYVYLQAYQPGTTTPSQPLVTYLSFYQGQTKVFETQPTEVTNSLSNALKTMPLRFNVGLAPLPPGEYTCQVTVLDPTSQKSAFWQAPITIVP